MWAVYLSHTRYSTRRTPTNTEIAASLVLCVRTVDTHVGAILNKLDAKTRREAVTRAKALGMLDVPTGPS